MIIRKKRLLLMYMVCMAVACLVAYNLLPPIQRDPPSFYHKITANDSNDLSLLLDQIEQLPQAVRADKHSDQTGDEVVSSLKLEDCSVWIPLFRLVVFLLPFTLHQHQLRLPL